MGDPNDDKGSVYAQGWGGDRYQVYGPASGADALVWYTVWDTPGARDRFVRGLIRAWAGRQGVRRGRRSTVEAVTVGGLPGARLVDAPEAWGWWKALPEVHVVR
jgi:hypothetical protein